MLTHRMIFFQIKGFCTVSLFPLKTKNTIVVDIKWTLKNHTPFYSRTERQRKEKLNEVY
jgi:hypothetical protein